MIEIMIVVALIGMLATIATPTWVRARTASQTNTCINNLKQIDGAKQEWGLENKAKPDATMLYSDISVYLKRAVICPAGGSAATFSSTYMLNDLSTKPTCQISPSDHVLPTPQ